MPQRKLVLQCALSTLCLALPIFAGPTVVPTAEGQIGAVPAQDDRVSGPRLESIRGQAGDILLGGISLFGGAVPPPPELQFFIDRIHGPAEPVGVETLPVTFNNIFEVPPNSNRSRSAADDGDFVAFSFAVDGAMPETMTVRVATFDETGTRQVNIPIAEDLPTFPDPIFSKTGVDVDNQGRVTVVYTELLGGLSRVAAQRFDATTGAIIDPDFDVNADGNHASTDVALLDPAGNRLIVTTSEFIGPGQTDIKANIVDFSGGGPVILPEFTVNTTAAQFANFSPAVAADPDSGMAIVAWENLSGQQGDPTNIRARRFDADGNPIGDDFRVNTTVANNQAQPAVAMGPGALAAIAWAGDSATQQDALDVFVQVFDNMGNPIGGELRVNTVTTGTQDRPTVRFLPEPDSLGQPQFVVAWRDTDNPDGSSARGTGQGYKCFSIGEDPTTIFADGFESGDTSSWSASQP